MKPASQAAPPAVDRAIRVNLTMPVTRLGFGIFQFDPVEQMLEHHVGREKPRHRHVRRLLARGQRPLPRALGAGQPFSNHPVAPIRLSWLMADRCRLADLISELFTQLCQS